MAVAVKDNLIERQYYGSNCYYDQYNNLVCGNSAWYNWIRWVVLAVVIVLFFLLFMACSCYSARRRRRQGLQPYYGTGWARGVGGYPQNQYGSRYAHYGQQQQFQPAPPYSPNPPPNYGQTPAGNFSGQQQSGIELEHPPRSFQPDGEFYPSPAGPPPGKKNDAVIR